VPCRRGDKENHRAPRDEEGAMARRMEVGMKLITIACLDSNRRLFSGSGVALTHH